MSIRFTVVTPTNRPPAGALRLLDALARQDFPAERFEAVVVVDGAPSVAEALRRTTNPFRLRVLEQPASGPAAARNRAVEAATEPYLLFLDDDVVPGPSLVSRHAAAHERQDCVVIGPLVAAGLAAPRPWTRWEWSTLAAQYDAMESGRWRPTPRQFYTGNASVRRDHVRAAGGFDTTFRRYEDVELAWRLHARGLPFVFEPLATAEHFANRTYASWLHAAYEYGRSDVMLEQIRTGGELPGWVRREFESRHPYTRLMARTVLKVPAAWPGVRAAGRFALRVPAVGPMAGVGGQVCSALFTAAYWRGVAERLGRRRALELTASARPVYGEVRP